jgi:hypothetical protein
MKGVGLYFFFIACVTLHPLPCLRLFIAELLPYELIRVSHVVHCTTATFVCKTFKFLRLGHTKVEETILSGPEVPIHRLVHRSSFSLLGKR